VTYKSIAYIATVTRFALSDEPSFLPSGRFPHCAFYHELLVHKDLMTENELTNLLEWWNEQIFPRSVYANDTVGVCSAGAIMWEQAKAKHAARAASVPPAESS